LCVKITAIPITIAKTLKGIDVSLKTRMINKGKLIAVIIAPNETKCEIRNTNKNIPKQTKAAGGCKAKITPNEVATPFPPLNPPNKGKT